MWKVSSGVNWSCVTWYWVAYRCRVHYLGYVTSSANVILPSFITTFRVPNLWIELVWAHRLWHLVVSCDCAAHPRRCLIWWFHPSLRLCHRADGRCYLCVLCLSAWCAILSDGITCCREVLVHSGWSTILCVYSFDCYVERGIEVYFSWFRPCITRRLSTLDSFLYEFECLQYFYRLNFTNVFHF